MRADTQDLYVTVEEKREIERLKKKYGIKERPSEGKQEAKRWPERDVHTKQP